MELRRIAREFRVAVDEFMRQMRKLDAMLSSYEKKHGGDEECDLGIECEQCYYYYKGLCTLADQTAHNQNRQRPLSVEREEIYKDE